MVALVSAESECQRLTLEGLSPRWQRTPKAYDGNVTAAERALGVSHSALYRRLGT